MTTKNGAKVLRAVTQRVVDMFTAQGSLFTALDVSNAVKGTLPDIRHREVAPLVRDLYERRAMGDYQHTLIDVIADGERPAQAYLYHLPEHHADLYDDSMRTQLAIPPVSASAQDDDRSVAASSAEAPVAIGRDGRGRVSRQLLHNAGIATEDVTVRVDVHAPRLVLSTPDPQVPSESYGLSELLTYEHPSLLHLPRSLMQVFGSGARLVARVVGATVEISPRH